MLGVFKNHKDTFVLENDFNQVNDVGMREFGAKSHLAAGRLRNAGILNYLSFLVRFEPTGQIVSKFGVIEMQPQSSSLLNCKLARLAIPPDSLVDSAICTGAMMQKGR